MLMSCRRLSGSPINVDSRVGSGDSLEINMAVLGRTMSLAFVLVLQALTFTAAVKTRQSAIISHLRDNSDPNIIPLPGNDRPVEVNLDLRVVKIHDVDCFRNEIEVLVWERQTWNNPALAWDATKEGFKESWVTIPSQFLWVPDITVDNAVSSLEVVSPSIAVVYSYGGLKLFRSIRLRVWCDLKGVDSISGANCSLKCGSWTQSNKTVSLSNRSIIGSERVVANPNYDILAASATKESNEYSCCSGESYDHIVFSFVVRKRKQPVAVPEKKNESGK
ncbi:hypothetical protein BsWGS_22699 [Bradybaena similaris]